MRFPSKASFREFLREHRLDFVGVPTDSGRCPIAELLRQRGYTMPHIGYQDTWVYRRTAGGSHLYYEARTPKWADRFMSVFDELPIREYTGSEVEAYL